jgi:hypothetical protein
MRLALLAVLIALAGAGAAIVLAIDARDDVSSLEERVDALEKKR